MLAEAEKLFLLNPTDRYKIGEVSLLCGDIYAENFYMLGKISEQQGDKAHARENYNKFLDLWKDADPGLPEVQDTRQRSSGIQ